LKSGGKGAPDKAKDDSEKPRVEEKETSDQKAPRFEPAVARYQRPSECALMSATDEIGPGPAIVKSKNKIFFGPFRQGGIGPPGRFAAI
jgi:hypothetical protein